MQPPQEYRKGPKVDGAAVRTHSQVPFGDDAQNADFYKTTNQEVYVPQNGKPANSDAGAQGQSSIPMSYFPGSMKGTTTQKTDYVDPAAEREFMDERALDRVSIAQKSIIHPKQSEILVRGLTGR